VSLPALLLQVVIALVIVGLVLWVISQIPMDPTIARIVRVVVIVFVWTAGSTVSALPTLVLSLPN
jgi:hypothetical protein